MKCSPNCRCMYIYFAVGKRIARVRSINMDRRLQQQQHSQAVTNSVGQTGEPFYDYPLAQLHPYHDLEGPTVPRQNTMGNYTTMQPAGSIREGAITPVGNGSHTIRSIYDDDLSQGDAALQNGAPQRVSDLMNLSRCLARVMFCSPYHKFRTHHFTMS